MGPGCRFISSGRRVPLDGSRVPSMRIRTFGAEVFELAGISGGKGWPVKMPLDGSKNISSGERTVISKFR